MCFYILTYIISKTEQNSEYNLVRETHAYSVWSGVRLNGLYPSDFTGFFLRKHGILQSFWNKYLGNATQWG
jgi:hypothetical protein